MFAHMGIILTIFVFTFSSMHRNGVGLLQDRGRRLPLQTVVLAVRRLHVRVRQPGDYPSQVGAGHHLPGEHTCGDRVCYTPGQLTYIASCWPHKDQYWYPFYQRR